MTTRVATKRNGNVGEWGYRPSGKGKRSCTAQGCNLSAAGEFETAKHGGSGRAMMNGFDSHRRHVE